MTDRHEHAQEFSNYDVLLVKAGDGELSLDDRHHHVGNNRFQVLSSMHRPEFDERLVAGESSSSVVDKIIDIVCRQAVPMGKFLVSESSSSWMVLTEAEAKDFVTDYLLRPAASSMTTSEAPPPLPSSGDLLRSNEGEEDKKRRRRSSLLRRSVSEGDFNDQKKKPHRKASVRFGGWLPRFSKPKADQLDIILSTDRTALVSGHTGNNRLTVMLDMQRATFLAAAEAAQQNMLQEIVSTVHNSYKGRFLMEKPRGSGYAVIDSVEQVHAILRAFLLADSTKVVPASTASLAALDITPPDATPRRPSVVKKLTMQALHALKPPSSTAQDDMHSAALESLQKRKQRQGLTKKIRDLTSGHRAAPASTLSRSASEPIHPQYLQQALPTTMLATSQSATPRMHSDGILGMGETPYHRPAEEAASSQRLQPVRDSVYSQLSEGMIEDLLQGLDVSEDFHQDPPLPHRR